MIRGIDHDDSHTFMPSSTSRTVRKNFLRMVFPQTCKISPPVIVSEFLSLFPVPGQTFYNIIRCLIARASRPLKSKHVSTKLFSPLQSYTTHFMPKIWGWTRDRHPRWEINSDPRQFSENCTYLYHRDLASFHLRLNRSLFRLFSYITFMPTE